MIFRYIKNNRGQAIVEMALVLPIILLIMAGTIEFGRILHQYIVVTAAAREGARSAAVRNDDTTVINTAKAAAVSIDRGQLNISIDPALRSRGDAVRVTVTNYVTINIPLISRLLPENPYPVQGTAIMRVE